MDPVLNSFLGYQGRPEKEDWWILPSWLTPSEEGKQVAPPPKVALWPVFSAIPGPAHPTLCPLLSHAQPGRATGVDQAWQPFLLPL